MDAHEGWVTVGVDGSAASDAAVRYAVAEARRLGTGVQLVHAVPDYLPAARPYGITVSDLEPTARQVLREASVLAHREAPDVATRTALFAGRRDEALRHAAQNGSEIVLGHDPRPSLARLATGSTVIAVAARAHLPVIVVPPDTAPGDHGRIAVGLRSPRHTVYGLLRRAFEVAAERHSALLITHAWEMPPNYEGLVSTAAEQEEMNKHEAAGIEEMVDDLAAQHPEVEHTIQVVYGNPARVLQEVSTSSDLLILARRAHVLPRGHIGGTARALLRHTACPLMFLPATEEPVRLPAESTERSGQTA